MADVTNTTEELKKPEKALDFLADQMVRNAKGERQGQAIEDMEAQGQWELLHSELLPTDMHNNTQGEFEALGFKFGDIVEDDPIFRYATLPEGWKREPGGNSYWSIIVDRAGNERVGIFYKAAFYDRHAHMYIRKDWDSNAVRA